MKRLLAPVLVVISVLHISCTHTVSRPSRVGDIAPHPASGFPTAQALSDWAGTSSFGGGGVTTYTLGQRQVYIVTRSITSGMATAELSVYIQKPNGHGVYKVLLQPTRLVQLQSSRTGNAIIITQYDQQTKTWEPCLSIYEHFFRDETTHLE